MFNPRLFLAPARKQEGVVLLITLIMLVAMTLAGIAIIRSVHTTTLIAGNMAFQQSTTQSGNIGSEQAINWLVTRNVNSGLDNHILSSGYSASRRIPPAGVSWESYWDSTLAPAGTATIAADSAGNTIQYVIDRMCSGTGSSTSGIGCATAPKANVSTNSSKGAGNPGPTMSSAVYYRIITRVQGPRSTASFIETMIAI